MIDFKCPRCGRVSAHPKDKEQGYCGNCHDWTGDSPHLKRIPPDTAPGTLYVRIVTGSNRVLGEHALIPPTGWQGEADSDTADVWLGLHPTDRVYNYIYDGDSGECVKTIIVDGIDG